MNYIRRILAAMAALAVFCGTCASADTLGTFSGDSSWYSDMGGGAAYYHNVFYSSSVGNQTENYVEYTPNSEAVPVVVNGASIYGKRTITSAADYMSRNNPRPMIGINADYFSLKTGIPMGYTIIDGRIYSKEASIQDAIGFRSDGTAFIDKIQLVSTASNNGESVNVQYINKWPQKGLSCMYLLTDDYGTATKTNFNGFFVMCTPKDGELSIGKEITLEVEGSFEYDGDIKIPEGKYIFVMDPESDPTDYAFMSSLAVGDTVTVSTSVSYSERGSDWSQAVNIVSAGNMDNNNRIINNGVIGSNFMTGTAPRTAVGVKENGNVIFYTIDGRQNGYSYGCRVETLANRLRELGCVDAINFDGGGSTAIGAVFPGSETFSVTNRPSDGALRSCANYIFLQDKRAKTGEPWYVEWNEIPDYNYLSGNGIQLSASKVYDTGNYKMDGLANVTFKATNTDSAASTVDENGYVSFKGSGGTVISVTGSSYSKSFEFGVYENPEEIQIINEATGAVCESISIYEGEMKNFELEASAYVNNVRLVSNPAQFSWETVGTLAAVDENGTLSVRDDGTESGTLKITCGSTVKEIPIIVIPKDTFSDISGHWAHDVIEEMADSGIINGIDEDGELKFKPDNNISRIQFAAIMCNSLGINPSDYSGAEISYIDADKIQPWAINYVKAMTALGYISGRSDDDGITSYIDPESEITRAEAFTIMGRVVNSDKSKLLGYADSADIPVWAQASFSRLDALGIISGYEDNTIRPGLSATRAEAAALVSKLIKTIN
ncbi:MAG: phosphodiester glycosidase family protein [Oscillospiraceae bacterium]|nr:phosphodiester glycosidase family protein [Oscillospiraceae bacterium]